MMTSRNRWLRPLAASPTVAAAVAAAVAGAAGAAGAAGGRCGLCGPPAGTCNCDTLFCKLTTTTTKI